MALDNAEFISELSISDPPGTDPLNQGDDHLRTIKKATQQSFPNIDAPVPQTAAQMGQMAIKNEQNTFTLTNTFTARQDIFENHLRFDQGATNRGVQWRVSPDIQWIIDNRASDSLLRFRRHNAGIVVDDPLKINNATGQLSSDTAWASNTVHMDEQIIRRSASNTFPRWRWQDELSQTQFEIYLAETSNDFVFQRRIDGVFQDIPFRIFNATGRMEMVQGLKIKGDAGGGNMLDLSGEGGAGFPGYQILSTTGFVRFQHFLFQTNNEIEMSAFDSAGASVGVIYQIDLATRVVDFKVRPTVNGVPI